MQLFIYELQLCNVHVDTWLLFVIHKYMLFHIALQDDSWNSSTVKQEEQDEVTVENHEVILDK